VYVNNYLSFTREKISGSNIAELGKGPMSSVNDHQSISINERIVWIDGLCQLTSRGLILTWIDVNILINALIWWIDEHLWSNQRPIVASFMAVIDLKERGPRSWSAVCSVSSWVMRSIKAMIEGSSFQSGMRIG
jgi:hypothetical protein